MTSHLIIQELITVKILVIEGYTLENKNNFIFKVSIDSNKILMSTND